MLLQLLLLLIMRRRLCDPVGFLLLLPALSSTSLTPSARTPCHFLSTTPELLSACLAIWTCLAVGARLAINAILPQRPLLCLRTLLIITTPL